jgi:hypothetical protein
VGRGYDGFLILAILATVAKTWGLLVSQSMNHGDGRPGAHVLLGVPFYDKIHHKVIASWRRSHNPKGPNKVSDWISQNSFPMMNFNDIWCYGLNGRKTHGFDRVMMQHADVVPLNPCWVDIAVRELAESGADLMGFVLPIKDERSLSSTMLIDEETSNTRQLTMEEILELPKRFDSSEFPGYQLCVGTGLWIADITKPWAEKVWFDTPSRIVKHEDGTFHAQTVSDDFFFSRWLHRLGAKVMASRALTVAHVGDFDYRNDQAWNEGAVRATSSPVAWGDVPDPEHAVIECRHDNPNLQPV